MDVDDLRRAFVGRAAFADQIRAFRRNRVNAVLDPNHPNNLVTVQDGPIIAVHLLPLGMVENPYRFSFTSLEFVEKALRTTHLGHNFVSQGTHNIDGVIMPLRREQSPAGTYIQVFRDGAVEYVETFPNYVGRLDEPLSFHALESRILLGLTFAIRLQRSLDFWEPCFVGVSIARTFGLQWKSHYRNAFSKIASPIKQTELLLPEQYVEAWTQTVETVMKPTFDIWANALGWSQSPNYDKNGNWIIPQGFDLPSIDL